MKLPHGQRCQPPGAGASLAGCWLRPDPSHNPQRREELQPADRVKSRKHDHVWFSNWTISVWGSETQLTSDSQKSKSFMPVLKFCCLLASFSFWLFSADLFTRNCHCSSRATKRDWRQHTHGSVIQLYHSSVGVWMLIGYKMSISFLQSSSDSSAVEKSCIY